MTVRRFELTRIPAFKRIFTSRWFQWTLMILTLPVFLLAILAGFFGTPAGSRNFAIIFVWIAWWALVILVMVPFTGRLWCAICPIPAPGEWLQRRALIQPRAGGKLFTLGWKWPRRLNNIWLQNISFLTVALFSVVILTTPFASALVLTALVAIAIVTSLLFERRVFCRYLCPVGGFIGLYSQMAPVEVRVKDAALCATHADKTCYRGNENGYGCPWMVFPAALDKNTYCGMCTECLKSCPLDNMGVFLRAPGNDLKTITGRRLDEAYKVFILLTCALAYSIVLIGPWSVLKESAYAIGSTAWFVYAGAFLAANLLIVPGIFFACAWLVRKLSLNKFSLRRVFVEFSYSLVPLGLAAWAAFTLSFVLINFSYAWQVLSDPLGWGWNLFGTANWTWTPYLASAQYLFQVPILFAGLIAGVAVAFRTARTQGVPSQAALPVVAFCTAFTTVLVWLYV